MEYVKDDNGFYVPTEKSKQKAVQDKQLIEDSMNVQMALAELAGIQMETTLDTQMAIAELANMIIGGKS